MSVAKSVATSPLRYSIVRSTAPRFAEDRKGDVPFGVYNTDRAHMKTTASQSRGGFALHAACARQHEPLQVARTESNVTGTVSNDHMDCLRLERH